MIRRLLLSLLTVLALATPAFATTFCVIAGDEADLRTTVSAAAAGDVVFVPAGTYTLTATITVTVGCRIYGEGKLTRILAGQNRSAFLIDSTNAIDRLRIGDMALVGNGDGTTGVSNNSIDGVHYGGKASKHLTFFSLERVTASGFRHGAFISGADISTGSVNHCTVSDCEFTTNYGRGVMLTFVSMGRVERCEVNGSGLNGIYAVNCPLMAIRDCAAEGNNTRLDTTNEAGAQVLVKLAHQFTISGLDVETLPAGGVATRIGICVSNCTGGVISGYDIAQVSFTADAVGVRMIFGSRGIYIASMTYNNVATAVTFDSTSPYVQPWPRTAIRF